MWINRAEAMMGPGSALCHFNRQPFESESERSEAQASLLGFVIQ